MQTMRTPPLAIRFLDNHSSNCRAVLQEMIPSMIFKHFTVHPRQETMHSCSNLLQEMHHNSCAFHSLVVMQIRERGNMMTMVADGESAKFSPPLVLKIA